MKAAVAIVAGLMLASAAAAPPAPARQRELIRLVRQDCGACHGMTLQGGLGSPLLPSALKDKAPDGLVATVLHGRSGTAMPAWESLLRPEEAEWIVARLLQGFPEDAR
jgi:cytochrome c55X